MTLDELLAAIDKTSPPAPAAEVAAFEQAIGHPLPPDYREFLVRCNGGYAAGGVVFAGPFGDVSINHVGGFRREAYFSLAEGRANYQNEYETRIPRALIWVADDPGGNAFCLGVSGAHRGRVYFWDHGCEPDPETWDGRVESAGNIDVLADSFARFVAGLRMRGS